MKTREAMTQAGVRYFSSLTPAQKDAAENMVSDMVSGLYGLGAGLRRAIALTTERPRIQLQGHKMFYVDTLKTWLPLKLQDILNAADEK